MIAIAWYTLRRMKEPAFLFLALIGCILAAWTSGAGSLDMPLITESLSQTRGAAPTTGMAFLLLFVLVFGIFLASTDIPRECQNHFISVLLSKPIPRRRYLLGKFLGLFAICYLLYLFLLLVLAVFSYSHFSSWNAQGQGWGAGLIAGLYLAPVLAVAVAGSSLVDEVPAVLFAVLYVLLSLVMMFVPFLAPWAFPAGSRWLWVLPLPFVNPLYFLFPLTTPGALGWLLLYAGAGSLFPCSLASFLFDRKDLL